MNTGGELVPDYDTPVTYEALAEVGAPDPSVRCEKCGRSDLAITWHDKDGTHWTRQHSPCSRYGRDWGNPEAEHLHYHCRTCQYDWTGPLTPAARSAGSARDRETG